MKRPFLVPLLLIVLVATGGIAWFSNRPDDTPRKDFAGKPAMTRPKDAQPTGARPRPDPRPKLESDPATARIWIDDTYENNLVGDLLKPFDGQALRELAARPERERNDRPLTELILRAAGERDASFRDLLDNVDLRGASNVDLALDAYDYAVTGSRKALERIVAKHQENIEKGGAGWSTDEIWVLGYIDEWDLTLKALQAHPLGGDGSGGHGRYAFWLTRRFLFPDDPDFPADYDEFYKIVYGTE